MSSPTNYAQLFGIHSIPAAFIFAVVYLPFDAWFIMQAVRRPNSVYNFLIVFCLIRTAAFTLRGILAASDSIAQNENAFITYEVLSGVGFFGILFSAYTLVLDRFNMAEKEPPHGPMAILRTKRLFHLVLIAGVIIGIVGTTDLTSSSSSTASTGRLLHKIGIAIFFVLTVVQVFLTVMLFRVENNAASYRRRAQATMWGERHGHYLLVGIAVFLLIREIFSIATIGSSKANQEDLWYPLVALTEVLAIVCYSIPGLVPLRSELREAAPGYVPAAAAPQQQYARPQYSAPQHPAGQYPQYPAPQNPTVQYPQYPAQQHYSGTQV